MERSYNKLITVLSDLVALDREDIALVQECFEPVSCPKGHLLLQAGQTARYMYFIDSGFLRLYYLVDGLEVTSQINCPLGFMTPFNSYITQTPSHEYFECITDCDLLRVRKSTLDRMYRNSANCAEAGRLVYEQVIVYNEQRALDMMTLSAELRYLKLMQEYPGIIQNVPLQYIASFIGIKPESLSRIRRKVIS